MKRTPKISRAFIIIVASNIIVAFIGTMLVESLLQVGSGGALKYTWERRAAVLKMMICVTILVGLPLNMAVVSICESFYKMKQEEALWVGFRVLVGVSAVGAWFIVMPTIMT